MNDIIKKAIEMMESEFKADLPGLEVGEEYKLSEVWDGEGEAPDTSYSYQLTDSDWINYEFDVVSENENPLDTVIRITGIDLI